MRSFHGTDSHSISTHKLKLLANTKNSKVVKLSIQYTCQLRCLIYGGILLSRVTIFLVFVLTKLFYVTF